MHFQARRSFTSPESPDVTITLIIVLASLLIVLRNGTRRIVRSLIAIAFVVLFLGDKALSEISARVDLPDVMSTVPIWNSTAASRSASNARHTLTAGHDGHFRTDVLVDGAAVRMLVDTGATLTAIRYEDAQRLGLIQEGLKFTLP
ncbi:MAG: retropepsin-like aspartic protease family protein, partial [Hyphomicrobiales bacterium]